MIGGYVYADYTAVARDIHKPVIKLIQKKAYMQIVWLQKRCEIRNDKKRNPTVAQFGGNAE